MRCNLCGGTRFSDMPKRPRVRCDTCGSLERTRLTGLHLAALGLPRPGAHVLHFAPERGLVPVLQAAGPTYRALDIAPDLYPHVAAERFDLCTDIGTLGTGRFDLIVHNHVLEHVECNYAAVLARLVRALRPNGTMLFSVPIVEGDFTDELTDGTPTDKVARFGPSLHVRRFGRAHLQRTLGMVVRIPESYDLTAFFSGSVLEGANIPPHHWHRFTGTSVFRVRPDDLLV